MIIKYYNDIRVPDVVKTLFEIIKTLNANFKILLNLLRLLI